MRRKKPDYSYKEQTRSIITDNIDPWQLIYKDEREGFHRYINRVVSLGEELETEAQYVENRFFPDTMDVSEEWVMFKPFPTVSINEVYLSGEPLSSVSNINEAENIDDFLSGYVEYMSGDIVNSELPYLESIVSISTSELYALTSGILYEIDTIHNRIYSSGDIENRQYQVKKVDFDSNNRICTIDEKYITGTIRVYTTDSFEQIYDNIEYDITVPIDTVESEASGIPFIVKETVDLTGIWNEDFDIDDNKYIGNVELDVLNNIYGRNMNDFSPEEWEQYSWADVNNNGVIDEYDYNAVKSAIYSASPEIQGVIEVPNGTLTSAIVVYEKDIPKPKYIYRDNSTYNIIMSDHVFNNTICKVVYDSHTSIYYGISNDKMSLKAMTYDDSIESITGDEYIFLPRWSENCEIIDIDIYNGHLFAIVGDGETFKIFYDDIWGEYVDSLLLQIELHLPPEFIPHSMSMSTDGSVIISGTDSALICIPTRDKYIEIDKIVYFNKKQDVTDSESNSLLMVPQLIFNSFDSFAFSLGIARPPGCDNIKMKEIIYDFYEHMQGHDNTGASYGIIRELGGTNIDISPSGELYFLPYTLDNTSALYINEYRMTKIEELGTIVTYSGDIGTVIVDSGVQIIPDSKITSRYDTMDFECYAIDGNGDSVECDYSLSIKLGYPGTSGDIEIFTLADENYLSDSRVDYISDNEITDEFIDIVTKIEDSNPLIYKNAEACTVPMDTYRISMEPLINTVYDPWMSGIIDPEHEISGVL